MGEHPSPRSLLVLEAHVLLLSPFKVKVATPEGAQAQALEAAQPVVEPQHEAQEAPVLQCKCAISHTTMQQERQTARRAPKTGNQTVEAITTSKLMTSMATRLT